MEPLLTPTEMAEADRRTVDAGTPVAVLMERAGRAVAWEVRRVLGGAYGRRAAVVCGKGNNGGDGLVAARVLRGWGVRVDVVLLADEPDPAELARALGRADVLVDAMYGTGFRGELRGAAAEVARRSATVATVAVDIPSGVAGATGQVTGPAVQATATVTFAARKPGLCFEPGRHLAGGVRVVDLGIDVGAPNQSVVGAADVARWWRPRAADAHKWSAAVLVVGGSAGMTGAPLLASSAAMRIGAGIVWCAVPGGFDAAAGGEPEIVGRPLPATDGALATVPEGIRAALGRFCAVVLGPGLGTAAATVAAVRDLVGAVPGPLVLDADGLNAHAGQADALRGRPGPTVLTPHAGEYERLLGRPVGPDRLEAARRLATVAQAVVLLKGPGTVVAEPGGRAAVVLNGSPALATAGSGDVLSGVIGGLLARGLAPFEAASAGAWLHGRAADLSGHTGLVAADLVRALPRALNAIT